MKNMLRFAACVVLLLVILSMNCFAVPKVAKEWTLPTFAGAPFRPVISGNYVISVQNVDDKGCGSESAGVIAYNVTNSRAYTVYKGLAGWCSIGGALAVWTGKTDNIKGYCSLKGDRSGSRIPSNLILVDTKNWMYYTPPITTGPANAPVVWGDYVAYEGKASQIYLLNMNDCSQKMISSGSGQHRNPSIGADLVVWEDFTNKRQIRSYRISTGQMSDITNDPGAEHCGPVTDGQTVVWWGNGEGITAYDLANATTRSISKAGCYPSISNNIVVYLKGSSVVGYDLIAGEEFKISSGKADCGPSISNGRVIWCLQGKIYCAQLQ